MGQVERYKQETISNSGLGALSVSPRTYRNYKDRVEQSSASYFNLGSAIHCMVLEPDEFEDRYCISTIVAPGGMYAKFIDVLFATRSKGEEFKGLQHTSWIVNAHGEAGFKWPVAKVWDKFENDVDLKGYYNALLATKDRILLSGQDDKAITACIKGIQGHGKAMELMYGNILLDCRNELEIIWKHPDHPWFMMKSIFDRVVIDVANKRAMLIDLKTTGKPVSSFKQSYKKFKYHRQMALYEMGLRWYIENEGYNIDEWTFDVYIVATQTNGYGDTAVYAPAKADLTKGLADADKLLHRMKWHFDNDKWDHPVEYYENDGVIIINLDDED